MHGNKRIVKSSLHGFLRALQTTLPRFPPFPRAPTRIILCKYNRKWSIGRTPLLAFLQINVWIWLEVKDLRIEEKIKKGRTEGTLRGIWEVGSFLEEREDGNGGKGCWLVVLPGKRVGLAGWTPAYYQSSFHNRGGRFRKDLGWGGEGGRGQNNLLSVCRGRSIKQD